MLGLCLHNSLCYEYFPKNFKYVIIHIKNLDFYLFKMNFLKLIKQLVVIFILTSHLSPNYFIKLFLILIKSFLLFLQIIIFFREFDLLFQYLNLIDIISIAYFSQNYFNLMRNFLCYQIYIKFMMDFYLIIL